MTTRDPLHEIRRYQALIAMKRENIRTLQTEIKGMEKHVAEWREKVEADLFTDIKRNEMKIQFPINPELGKFYSVPHVFAEQLGSAKKFFIPISTPLHNDNEVIKIQVNHWHIDWRFIPKAIYDKILDGKSKSYVESGYIITYVENEDYVYRENIATSKEITYLKRRCQRHYSTHLLKEQNPKLYATWPIQLQKHYCGKSLKQNEYGQYVCPHKGAIMDMNCKDKDGYIVCPAHQLRFDNELKAV